MCPKPCRPEGRRIAHGIELKKAPVSFWLTGAFLFFSKISGLLFVLIILEIFEKFGIGGKHQFVVLIQGGLVHLQRL